MNSRAASDRAELPGLGIAAVLGAALCTSLSGILIRSIEQADGWQILFWRSVACAVTLLIYLGWRHGASTGDSFMRIGRFGLAVSLSLSAAFICFIFAVLNTTVANVTFIIGIVPVFAALLGWLILRERIALRTVGFIALSLAGIGLMFGDGVATGGLFGILLALLTCVFFAVTIVMLRGGRRIDMIPAVTLAAVLAGVAAAAMAPNLAVSYYDFGIVTIMGVVQLGFQYILLAIGTRHIPAAQAALIGRVTIVLTPLWAWLGVGETPSVLTLAGGALVLSAIMGQGLYAMRRASGPALGE